MTLGNKKIVFASYDFSNSGYVLIFQAFLFPLYLVSLGGEGGPDTKQLWAWMVSVSSLIAIFVSPFLGRFADSFGRGKVFAITVLFAGIVSALSPTLLDDLILVFIAFIVFNTLFELSQTLYDSFLRDISNSKREALGVSSFAWGFGYLGGALFAIVYLLLSSYEVTNQIILLVMGCMYMLLSIPSIKYFGAYSNKQKNEIRIKDVVRVSPPIEIKGLLYIWIIAECVATVLYFSTLFLNQEIGLSEREIGALLLATQVLAFPMTIFMGKLAIKFGEISWLKVCMALWLIVLVGLYFSTHKYHVYGVMVVASLVIGSTQAILRGLYSGYVKEGAYGEGFGFYAVAQKSAAVLGPLIVALVLTITNKIQPAFIVIGLMLVIAWFVINKLPNSDRY